MLKLRRLLSGSTCPVCGRRRRVVWFADTGVCTIECLTRGLSEIRRTPQRHHHYGPDGRGGATKANVTLADMPIPDGLKRREGRT